VFQVGIGEAAVIAVVAILVIGPERLPKYAAEAGRLLRQLRRMAQDASADLRSELGPEFADVDIADLHPKRFVRKHLFEDFDTLGLDDAPTTATRTQPPAERARPLEPGERPPYDADAT
jgi:sec-independent protein translocase protein TatB